MDRYISYLYKLLIELKGDFYSCLYRANYLIHSSSQKGKMIFFGLSLIILLVLIFTSTSEATFYLNLLKIVVVTIATFVILCLSDTFWFLIKKSQIYNFNINNRRRIKRLYQELSSKEKLENNHLKAEVQRIVYFYSDEYKYHAKRNVVEISLIILLLLFTFPTFAILNLVLFGGMFVYIFLYEQESVNQAFDDINSLIFLINESYKNNPKECKKFIIHNENQDIRKLKLIYDTVSRI